MRPEIEDIDDSSDSSPPVAASRYKLRAKKDAAPAADFVCTMNRRAIEAIRSGEKTHEGRPNTDFFRSFQPGRTVRWVSADRSKSVTTEIISREDEPSVDAMLSHNGYKKFIPGADNHSEALRIYSCHFDAEHARQHGVVSLGLSPVSLFKPMSKPTIEKKRKHFQNSDEEDAAAMREQPSVKRQLKF